MLPSLLEVPVLVEAGAGRRQKHHLAGPAAWAAASTARSRSPWRAGSGTPCIPGSRRTSGKQPRSAAWPLR